jgi:glycerophosphodiester phosphodiesterase
VSADRDNSETHTQGLTGQSHGEAATSLFLQMLDQLGPSQSSVLQANDTLGRLPLHYGAIYGLTAICQSILNSLQKSGHGSSAAGEAVLSVDSEGYTPLHSAVIHNHPAVTRLFLDTLEMNYQTGNEARDKYMRSVLGGLLVVALKSQHDNLVHLLVSSHIDVSHRSSLGETPLYVAARIGREDYVKLLLKAGFGQDANIDASETIYGWTPLFIACAEGYLAVVKLLLQAGASQTILDHRGWTAKEHATFRGHLAVAKMLEICKTGDPTGGPANTPFKTAVGSNYHLRTGHNYIIANLGVMQKRKQVTAIDLNCCSSEHTQILNADTRFSIEVSAPGGSGPSHLVQLPILDDMTNEPFVFPIKNPNEAQLVFTIFSATSAHGQKGVLVGSGTALLESQKHCFGAKRESLIREHTVPILERETLKSMGTVTFTFVIAKTFMHLNTPPINDSIKETDSTQLFGHRGMFSTSDLCR